ncbi:MAG TPA: hypothetical protein VLD40_00625 [Dissulfurispiraceae bacterium]|nr:hypothetical protein [Dissulfurispiraceae bacterium]
MSIGVRVGHSYFGAGIVLSVIDGAVTVDFGYPYGVRTLDSESVQTAA